MVHWLRRVAVEIAPMDLSYGIAVSRQVRSQDRNLPRIGDHPVLCPVIPVKCVDLTDIIMNGIFGGIR